MSCVYCGYEYMACKCEDASDISGWTIKLTYFKPSGKYYTHSEYRTTKAHMFEIADEVQCLIERGALPGLAAGHQEYYHVLIDAGDHPNAYPVLVPSREVTR